MEQRGQFEEIAENLPNQGNKSRHRRHRDGNKSTQGRSHQDTLKQQQVLTEILKNRVTYKGNPLRLSEDFSAEILQIQREWHDIFKKLKEKTCSQEYCMQEEF